MSGVEVVSNSDGGTLSVKGQCRGADKVDIVHLNGEYSGGCPGIGGTSDKVMSQAVKAPLGRDGVRRLAHQIAIAPVPITQRDELVAPVMIIDAHHHLPLLLGQLDQVNPMLVGLQLDVGIRHSGRPPLALWQRQCGVAAHCIEVLGRLAASLVKTVDTGHQLVPDTCQFAVPTTARP